MSNAKKPIGFDRKIQLDWLDVTAGWGAEGLTPREIRNRLDEFLDGKVAGSGSHSAKGKTKTVLLHIWVLVPDSLVPLRDGGLALYQRLPAAARLPLHWGMCLATYPFFRDVGAATGRLLQVQGTAARSQVLRRMAEGWGERSTLSRAVARVMRSFVDWGVLRETPERGVFTAAHKLKAAGQKQVYTWLLEACLWKSGGDMVGFRQLVASPALFPFRIGLTLRDLRGNPGLEIIRQGLDEDYVRLRAHASPGRCPPAL